MRTQEAARAVAAGKSMVGALGLRADDAVVLHDSNRLAVRLLPCDVLARVAPMAQQAVAEFEVRVARELARTASPVAELEPRVEPRVYRRDDFAITLWTYYSSVSSRPAATARYAEALHRLHAGMRHAEVPAPHFTTRIAQATSVVESTTQAPELAASDRALLTRTLHTMGEATAGRGVPEQLLHGEPHPGNVLRTRDGLLFVDLETCCRGPIEFDIAHMPEQVGEHYATANQDLLRKCRLLVLAMITAWRWDRDDEFPNGRQLRHEWLGQLRTALG